MSRPYVTANRVVEIRAMLSADDWAVLHDVAAMRVAAAADLGRLQALRGPLHVRRFRRRLARLSDLAGLARLERSVGGKAAGSAGWLYGLGVVGQRLLLSGRTGRARPPWTPRAAWLGHAIAVGRLYVELREAEADGTLKLERFDVEPTCWRAFSGPYGPGAVLKPDAYVEAYTEAYEHCSFVEVDCGTESPATLGRKFDGYRHYWQSGHEQVEHDVFPRVVWLVPDEHRLGVLVDVAARQPAETWALHTVALYDRALPAFLGQPP